MIDQEQTTTTNETETSGSETTSANPEQGSNTSTTEQERISLADTDDQTETEQTSETEETEEQRAAREEHETLFGAPAEGENYQIEGLPEGMAIDEEALAAVTPVARELGLSSKGLSKIANVYAEKVLPNVAKTVTTQIEQNVVAQRTEWEGQARDAIAGKEVLKNATGDALAFDTTDMKAVRAVAAKALDKLAPAGFREFLDETGLAVHPAMVAFAYQAGKAIAEDSDFESAETSARKEATPSERRRAGGMDQHRFYGR